MSESVNVAIVGAGQAGLATSWHLKQLGVDHVILEAGRVGETWRSRRWDSFCLVTPNWTVRLPGGEYRGPDPDGFMDKGELIAHFQGWADSFQAPVREGCAVTALDADGEGFGLSTSGGRITARSVVVATGGYQRPFRPANASQVPAGVDQLLGEEYSCPDALEPGAVLIIGSGQTGCQIAEELHANGRRVSLSCGRAPWAPRRMGGRDLVWWIVETGWWQRKPGELPSPAGRLLSNPLATGHGGGRDLHLRTLHERGIELLGRFSGAEGGMVYFGDDLAGLIAAGDSLSGAFKKRVDALAEQLGLPSPWDMPPPPEVRSRTEVDLSKEGIRTVIWTTGFRPDYTWMHFPVFDDMGFPVQVDGRSSVPGLHFMGVHFQRKAQSAVLYGVGEDAEIVAREIAENRRPIPAFGGTSP